jgi:hypothetical protein
MEILHPDDKVFFANRSGDRPSHYVRDDRLFGGTARLAATFYDS